MDLGDQLHALTDVTQEKEPQLPILQEAERAPEPVWKPWRKVSWTHRVSKPNTSLVEHAA
jgi:hypothetical protein